MLRKLFRTIVVTTVVGLAPSTVALAGGNPHGVTLNAPSSVSVNYDHCWDANGNPLPCLTVPFTLSNGSNITVSCKVSVSELGGFLVFDGQVSGGSSAGGSFTTAYVAGTKSLTL